MDWHSSVGNNTILSFKDRSFMNYQKTHSKVKTHIPLKFGAGNSFAEMLHTTDNGLI